MDPYVEEMMRNIRNLEIFLRSQLVNINISKEQTEELAQIRRSASNVTVEDNNRRIDLRKMIAIRNRRHNQNLLTRHERNNKLN